MALARELVFSAIGPPGKTGRVLFAMLVIQKLYNLLYGSKTACLMAGAIVLISTILLIAIQSDVFSSIVIFSGGFTIRGILEQYQDLKTKEAILQRVVENIKNYKEVQVVKNDRIKD